MSDLKITDLLDEQEIEKLKALDEVLLKAKDSFVEAAREMSKGLNVHVTTSGDLEKLNAILESSDKKIRASAESASKALKDRDEIIRATTNTISRELAEIEKENAKKREAVEIDKEAVDIARRILRERNGNFKSLVMIERELKEVKELQKMYNEQERDGVITTEQLMHKQAALAKREKELKVSKQELNKILNNEEKLSQAAEGSYTKLSLQLELLKKAYKELNDEEKAGDEGVRLAAEIGNLDAHLKDLAADMGEFQRNTGNYAIAGQSAKKELKELVLEIADLTVRYRSLNEEQRKSPMGQGMIDNINTLTKKASELKDAIGDVNDSIKNSASDTAALDSVSEGINLLVNGFGAATGAARMLGLSEKDLEEIQTDLQAAFVTSNAVIQIQNSLQKQNALMKGVTAVQSKAAAAAIAVETAAQGKNVVVTKAAMVAQKALNLVAKANPYVLLATAVVTVVGAFALFASGAREAKKEQEKLSLEIENTKKQLKAIEEDADFDIAIAEASGASAEELRKMRYEALAAAESLAWLKKLEADEAKKKKKISEEDYNKIVDAYKDAKEKLEDFNNKNTIEFVKNLHERKKATVKTAAETIDILKQQKQAELQLMADGLEKELQAIRNAYAERLDAIKGSSEEENRLRQTLKEAEEKEITDKTADYERQREKMLLDIRMDVAEEGSRQYLDARLRMMEIEEQEEIEQAMRLGVSVGEVMEKYARQRAQLETEMELRGIQERYAAETEARNTAMTMEQAELARRYAEHLITKEEYEKESLAITRKYAIETAQAAVEALEAQMGAGDMSESDRLKLEQELAKAKADLAKKTADIEVETEEEVTEEVKKQVEKRMQLVEQYAQYASQMIGALSDLFGNIYEGRIQKIEEEQKALEESKDKELERIDQLAEAGAIGTEEAEARKRAAQQRTAQRTAELEKKKADLQYKQAVWDKAASLAQAAIATALAVTKALPNIPLSVIVGALGAVQMAAIAAQPIPKYARGTDDHPGGAAIVGDGGRRELIAVGDRLMVTPDRPTLVDLPRHAKVYPDADRDLPFLLNRYGDIPRMPEVSVNSTVTFEDSAVLRAFRESNELLKYSIRQSRSLAAQARFENYKRTRL